MTDRPFVGGADTAVDPTPGYYPDPSIPGFVRYWGGTAWVPGTSRPAPGEGEVLEPPRFAARQAPPPAARYVPPPSVQSSVPPSAPEPDLVAGPTPAPAPGPMPSTAPGPAAAPATEAAIGETGPLFFDQTSGGASFVLAPEAELELELRRRSAAEAAVPAPAPDPASVPVSAPAPVVAPAPLSGPAAAPEPARRPTSKPQPAPESEVVPARAAAEPADALHRVSWGSLPARPNPSGAPAPAPAAATAAAAAAATSVSEPTTAPEAVPARKSQPVSPTPRGAAVRKPTARAARPSRPSRPVRPAALGRRLAARLFDSMVIAMIAVGAGVPLVSSAVTHMQDTLDHAKLVARLTHHEVDVWLLDAVVVGKAGVLLGVLVLAGVLYEVLPTARTGQTLGKRLMGIKVVRVAAPARGGRPAGGPAGPPAFGRSLLRWIVRQISVFSVVGLLSPLFDPAARRGWQDRAARTRVVRS
ncbi:RDD family protein [Kitasatospora sp. NPDC056138]|uniref:RDD family protein n=1 Tax=Kitasatospora sp. NPDC056138 TaxID=3345724 RepID=UPI0035DC4D4F